MRRVTSYFGDFAIGVLAADIIMGRATGAAWFCVAGFTVSFVISVVRDLVSWRESLPS